MKNKSIRVVLPVVVFAVVILSFACSTSEPSNTNTTTRGGDDEACAIADIKARANAVNERIKSKVQGKGKLKKQFENGRFTHMVRKSSYGDYDFLEVIISGEVSGDDELKNLADIVNDFQEIGCVQKVILTSDPLPTEEEPDKDVKGLVWYSCEWPSKPCRSGCC